MSYSSTIIADTPYAYWRMDDASGNLTDSSGNSRTAIQQVAPFAYQTTHLTTESGSYSVTFSNSASSGGGAFQINTFGPSGISEETLECWISVKASVSTYGHIIGWRSSVGGASFYILQLSGTTNLECRWTNSGFGSWTINTTLTANTTYHVVFVKRSTSTELWVNGVHVGTQTGTTGSRTSDNFGIGRDTTGSNFTYRGILDEAAYYNYALSSGQIAAHYAAGIAVSTDYTDSGTVGSFTTVLFDEQYYVESSTVPSITILQQLEEFGRVDSNQITSITEISSIFDTTTDQDTISSKTNIQSLDFKGWEDSALLFSKTTLQSVEEIIHVESATISSITTPDVVIEEATTVTADVSLSGLDYVGSTITASVNIGVSGGVVIGGGGGVISDPDEPGYTVYYSTTGQWGSSDTDNGQIADISF